MFNVAAVCRLFAGGMVKTATNQSKRINLLSSTMDLFSELLAKFQLIQLCNFCSAVIISKISRAQICFARPGV